MAKSQNDCWMYEYVKKHMSKDSMVSKSFQLDIGFEDFMQAVLTNRNAVTTRTWRMIDSDNRER